MSIMDIRYNMINGINTAVCYTHKRVNPKGAQHKESIFFYFFPFVSV